MKLIDAIGTIVLMVSSVISANEIELKDYKTLNSETLNVFDLLSYVEDAVELMIAGDEEISQIAYHELQEKLKIVYILSHLYRDEESIIQ